MNRWDRDWYPSSPKKPPPAEGIRVKKAGTTWWGQRWIEALENVLAGQAGRLARGRTYARAGRTHDLAVHGGKVTAKVTGSRPRPYEVTITLSELSKAEWSRAIAGMASKAQFSAELLGGVMPEEVEDVFRAAGVHLFPGERSDLVTSCSCPDWGDPCKHVAATHYVLGEALDRDPFLLFELRGRTKDDVLEALRAARGGQARSDAKTARKSPGETAEVPKVALRNVEPSEYEKPRAPLPILQFAFDAPATHGAVLRQLGSPAAWSSSESLADALSPLVRAAAETARRIALAETESREEGRALAGAESREEGSAPAGAESREKGSAPAGTESREKGRKQQRASHARRTR